MEQSSPSPSIVASVPVSTQSAPSSLPHESGHVIEQLPRSSPKTPAVSAPVSVPAQSVTVSAAPATVTVSAFPVTVPVSALVSVAPVTVTAPAPATVTASSAMVTTSVPPTAIAPVPTSSSGLFLLPRCVLLLLLLPVITIFLSFLVIRTPLTASRGLISGNI